MEEYRKAIPRTEPAKKSIGMDIIGLMLIISVFVMAYHKKENQPSKEPMPPHFEVGQMLLPDYAVPDTLIVVDPVGLNREIVNSKTDWEIAGTMYRHCAIYGQEQAEYGINIVEEGYQIIDNTYKNSVTVPWNVNLDSLLLKFNE